MRASMTEKRVHMSHSNTDQSQPRKHWLEEYLGRTLGAVALLASCIVSAANAQAINPNIGPPTTKILAIGSLTAPLSPDEMKTLMPNEATQTVELYLNGKIDQWWFRQDGEGVVFLMNVTSVDEADSLLKRLPLGVARRMTFQLMPLGPLKPLRILLGRPGGQ